jgi:tRNA threonylcarbamoyladenosine biosynthesis protein TsaE
MDLEITTTSPRETQQLASRLVPFLSAGDVIGLTGDLGAGKTCFTQGLARALGIKGRITSPTFNLIKEYRGRLPLYHFDVFRLESIREMFELDYEGYFFGEGVTVIEWGDKVAPLLPREYLEIEFRRLAKENYRKIRIKPHGAGWQERINKWLKENADLRI